MINDFMVTTRSGDLVPGDIKKIQKKTDSATFGIKGVSAQDLEAKLHIQFYNGITTKDIQTSIIKTSVDMIDIDTPNYTYVAAKAFLDEQYHVVGNLLNGAKGVPYSHSLKDYLDYGVTEGRINNSFYRDFDLDELNRYIVPERDFLFNYLGIKASYDRYLLKNRKKELFELPQHMFMGIAMFLAQNEKNKMFWAKKFYDTISMFEIMLATPTLSNARTNRNQLSSCFQGSAPDSIEGIFDSYKDMALLSKYGGGIGWDWANIRSSNAPIDGHIGAGGGLIPWLKITNDIAIGVDQLGTRKGAIAVYIEPWHLDVKDFLDLKKNAGEERRRAHDLFPGLWINDLFMKRVEEDGIWTLFDPYDTSDLHELYGDEFEMRYCEYEFDSNIRKETVNAKDLWKKILLSYYETGSPFLGFKDEANRRNANSHDGIIRCTNLCTEIFQNTTANKYAILLELDGGKEFLVDEEVMIDVVLIDGTIESKVAKKLSNVDRILVDGNIEKIEFISHVITEKGETLVCNLGSVNLSKVNSKEDMARVVPIGIRMLDNVIDLNMYPIKQAYNANKKSRAIGLGVMGEAQMLAEKGIYFGSDIHLKEIDKVMEWFSFYSINASADLAVEKGAYPLFEGSKWSKGILPIDTANKNALLLVDRELDCDWDELREKVISGGMRNGYLMAIAPTSTISIVTGTTQAIEPIYRVKYYEENLSGLIPVVAPNISPDTISFYQNATAYNVDQLNIVRAGGVRQKWIDQGQSLNIFMRKDKASGQYLNNIYMLGWKLGLKATYYLRSESPEEIKTEVIDRGMECSGCQ